MKQSYLPIFFLGLLAMLPIFSHAQINLDSGLVAYYPFNGNALDSSGNGNHGILHGPIAATGESGDPNTAFYFDGIDDWINLGDGTGFRFQADQSFSLVAKVFVEQPTNYGNILRYDDDDEIDGDNSPTGIRDVILFRINDQGFGFNAQFGYGRGPGNSGLLTSIYSSTYLYNQWYWITGTYDAKLDSAYLYIGSCLEAGAADNAPSGWITTGQFLMSGRFNTTEFFKGKIEEMYILDRAIEPNFEGGKCDTVSTGIADQLAIDIRLFPNPSSGHFTIESPQAAIQNIRLYDLTGRGILAQIDLQRHEAKLNCDYKGIALLHIQTEKGIAVRKLVFK